MLAAVLAAGCAAPPPVGGTLQDVLARFGPPTDRQPLPGAGERLTFWSGPAGRETWMVDMAADGRIAAVEQVRTLRGFERVREGMTTAEVLHVLGPPSYARDEWRRTQTWYWRYINFDCLIAAATFSPPPERRVVGGMAIMTDPACDLPDR